jgi:hypothetical protein
MRHAIRNVPETAPDSAAGVFIVGAVLCAALMVALFAFNGGPDLLGGRFDSALTAFRSP